MRRRAIDHVRECIVIARMTCMMPEGRSIHAEER